MKETCFYCGKIATTIDHVVPKAMGGSSRKDNLVPACKSCNSNKSDMPKDIFIKFLEFCKKIGQKRPLNKLSRTQRKMMKYRFLKETGIQLHTQCGFTEEIKTITLPREERLKALQDLGNLSVPYSEKEKI